jgi:hypothetical protein
MKNITMPHHRRTEESSPAQTRKRSEDSWVAKGCQLDIMRTRHASGSPRGKSRCSPGMAKHSQGRNSRSENHVNGSQTNPNLSKLLKHMGRD